MSTHRRWLSVLLVVALLVTPMSVAAADPRFEAYVSNPSLQPGQVNEVTVQLLNDAASPQNTVETAENLRVSVDDDDLPFTVLSGPQVLGNVNDGQAVPITLRLRVPSDVDGDSYTVPLILQYESNSTSGRDDHEIRKFVQVRVEDQPRFEIVRTNTTAPVGGTGTVEVVVENVGEQTATKATATLQSTSTDVRFGQSSSASRYVDEWDTGETRTLRYRATVASDAEDRSYPLRFSVNYTDEDGTKGASQSLSLGVTPLSEQTFDAENVQANLRVGSEGNLEGRIVNTGNRSVSNAVIVFENASGASSVRPTVSEYAIGDLNPGESTQFDFGVSVADDADAGPRQLSLRVRYRNPDGDPVTSDQLDIPVSVTDSPQFEIANVRSTLRVGEEGTIRGAVVNRGDAPVDSAVVVFESPGGTVSFTDTEYAIGDLGAGERANFSFDGEVTEEADAGPRQFTASVRYRNDDGEQRQSDTYDVRVQVAPQKNEFDVRPINATLSAGESGELRVEITNTRETALTDVSAKVYPETPLSSDDAEAFVPELGPGESTTLVFGTSVDGEAMNKTYPLKMDFQYEDPEGDTQISETYRIPVQVTVADDGGLPVGLIVGALLVVVIAAGGYLYLRRR